tara:strand:+ start:628 stop:759 length:132 start_codon:yes stop_codon:yes gene_type:complete
MVMKKASAINGRYGKVMTALYYAYNALCASLNWHPTPSKKERL